MIKKIIKIIYYSALFLCVLFGFSSCASASSLNISDFDLESFTSPLDFNSRNCSYSQTFNSSGGGYQNICSMSFSQNEWTNNFLKSNYNFLVVQINHSGVYNNLNFDDMTTTHTVNMVFMVDYTLNMYITDVNNKSYPCDIVNNNIAMCRYDRNTRISSLNTQLVYLGSNVSNALKIETNIFYPKQYNLTSYASMNKAITEVNNNITNSTINFNTSNDGASNKLDSFTSMIPTNGSVSQLLTLPINLASAFSSGLSGQCSQFNLGSLFGTNIILPCVSMSNLLGSTLWVVIDILIGGFMVYAMGKKIVRVFNDITSLKDNQIDDLYGGGA